DSEECVDGIILGGIYPPPPTEPEINEGYCSHPIATHGYLCRPQEKPLCPKTNTPNSGAIGGEIFLSECTSPFINTPNRITESSMNICGEDGWLLPVNSPWKDTPRVDNNLSASQHKNCYVDMICGSCPAGTGLKEENGRIELCIDPIYEPLTKYLAIRELVHARQQCDTAYNDKWAETYETINGCCAMEIQASTTACNALEEDGVLLETNIPVESCAISFSNLRCQSVIGSGGLPPGAPAGAGICGDNGLNMRAQDLIEKIKEYVLNNTGSLQVPLTCEETILHPDKRMKMIEESLSQVCSPEYNAEYKNTIGNALCHIGQCTEQSLEEHKIIPGRITWTVEDEAFPWESFRGKSEIEKRHSISIPTNSYIPPYQPLAKLRKMENSLCESKGMPRTSIPAFCNFDTTRRTSLPSKTHGVYSQDASIQENKSSGDFNRLISLLPAVGARNASDLLMEYFKPATISLKGILQNINSSFEKMESTEFPLEMCPRLLE
ncbi:MAG: hypothetical protein KAS32_04785, partial [Candidatus Peribacteraceae bacterium]|nr:hypothetical protein [Candidatus Peribacteraceae bacterium]